VSDQTLWAEAAEGRRTSNIGGWVALRNDGSTSAKISGDRPNADAHIKAILRLFDESRLSAMVKNAKDDPIVRVDAAAFDRKPMLLNVADGTLDLETFVLRPFDKNDLLTGALAVPYTPGARSEFWARHIRYLAAASDGTPRPELEAFYWRALGYTLLGDNPERVLFFLKGRTTAGKSVLQEGVRALFGDYAGALSFHSLLKPGRLRTGGDTTRPDLVQLLGKRFVTAGEPNPDGDFDVALIK
jgi:putative DNA primase/helicase